MMFPKSIAEKFCLLVLSVFLLIGCNPDNGSDTGPGTVSSSAVSIFNHPGGLNTEEDFQFIREKVAAGEEPWLSTWGSLTASGLSQLGQTPAPLEQLIRGGDGSNYGRVIRELRIAYALALRWAVSEDDAYADLAIAYLNDWSATLQSISGNSDRYLASGLYGYQFAVIGELMRSYDGWSKSDQQQLASMLVDIFYPMNHEFLINHNDACISNYWANWDLANLASMMAIGVFAEREDIYQEALDYLYNGTGNGALDNLVFYLHPGNMGQYQESGRDQGHTTLGVSLYGVIAKIAWNQGDDLFAYNNYSLLAASEYIARYNLYEDVPYTPYGPNCKSATSAQTVISENSRGRQRPSWALIYNHYQNRLGIAAPWSEQMANAVAPEGPGNGDELGWTSLTDSLDDWPAGGSPRGLTAHLVAGTVELSWWGAAGAESYQLKRSLTEEGTYSVIASLTAGEDLTYTDTTISDGVDYYYQVTAVSSEGESAPSETVVAEAGSRLKLQLTFNESGDSSEGVSGAAHDFNGNDDYVDLGSGVVADLADFTISTWVYLNSRSSYVRIFDFGASDQRYMMLTPGTRAGETCFAITKISYHAEERVCSSSVVPVGEWVHLAVTLSGSTATLYVNGTAAATNTTMTLAPHRLGNTGQNWLGRSQYSADPYLDGQLDDFRIYSGALSAAEIAALASAI